MPERFFSRREVIQIIGAVSALEIINFYANPLGIFSNPQATEETTPKPSETLSIAPSSEPSLSPKTEPSSPVAPAPKLLASPVSITSPKPEATPEKGIITPGEIIDHVNTKRKAVCFTFDDGGSRMRTVFKTAVKKGIPMTVFPTGLAINNDPKLYRDMYHAGFEIGNHTQNHLDLSTRTEKQIEEQILMARESLWNALQREITQNLVRPPYGATSPNLITAAKKLGYEIVMWDVTSAGTSKYATVDSIKNRVEGSLRNGAIILQHPTPYDTAAFPFILNNALSRGYKPVTVTQGLS